MKHPRSPWAALAAMAALALLAVAASPALAATGTPKFDRCLAQNGLSAPPADQARQAVQVCKTVRVTKITTYAWTLTKTPSPAAITLAPGQSAMVTYTLAATATPTVRWVVDGDVVVRNVGAGDASVARVADTLRLAGGATQSTVLSSRDLTLSPSSSACPCVCPPEESFHYSFTVDDPPATGTNTASVDWSGKASGSSSFSASVDFTDGPATNSAVYFRTATLTDAYGAPPTGLLVGVPDRPGPFVLGADQPSGLSVTLASQIRNESMACSTGASVTDTATLTSAAKPEETNRPTSSGRPPAVTLASSAAVQVTATACRATENQQPPLVPAPTSQPPQTPAPPSVPLASSGQPPPAPAPQAGIASTPVQPPPVAVAAVPSPSICVTPALVARILGPRTVVAGSQVTWRISVRNVGAALARSVVLSNRLPDGFSLVRSSPRARFGSGVATFRLPNLRSGQTATVRLTMHASRGVSGRRLQQARIVTGCGGREAAVAPIRVSAVAGAINPAVTG
ncbi:MAG: hypothetical protein QOK40_1993 [Miltoncostaeaceae bacterium]|nr:hypothetical protein [Miltoncostaeaceae bacterium]